MKRRTVTMILIIILILFNNNVYAKYVYNSEETVVELTRDANAPICNVSYSIEDWTNQNVIVTITSNKEIEQVSGFELSADKKVLTKELSENEYGIVKVRDFSGNYTEVEYNVSNIDKEPPQIIGCEDGGTYSKPLILDYTDNVEIKDILVDKYDDNLSISSKAIYYDSFAYYGLDRTSSTITVKIDGHPKNTNAYKYYINNKLYTTTEETKYVFTGLNKGTTYTVKVEAIDKLGNVLETKTVEQTTTYFGNISSTKTSNDFIATLRNIDSSVAKIRYAVWNYYNDTNFIWYDAPINNGTTQIGVTHFDVAYYPSYVIHAYFYDANDQFLSVQGFSIDLRTSYTPKKYNIDKNNLTQSGNYQIIVNDLAGNEIIYYIKVK